MKRPDKINSEIKEVKEDQNRNNKKVKLYHDIFFHSFINYL